MTVASQASLFSAEEYPLDPTPFELAAESDQLAAEIVFNRPVDTTFSYLIPDALRGLVGPGQRVSVPFGRGNRPTVGFCVRVGPPRVTERQLKSIESVIDREPLLPAKMLELTQWIAERYLCTWGQVLETVVPAGVKKGAGTRVVQWFHLTDGGREALSGDQRLGAKQKALLETLAATNGPMRGEDLAEAADCGTGPIDSLRKRGWIRVERRRTDVFEPDLGPVESTTDLTLNIDQSRALQSILGALRESRYQTFLLHGVTGSGKTEVYIQAIREVVRYGRQAIVLVPEISLTPQTIRRFRSRFDSVAVLHSHLSDSERHWQWQRIARGEVQVVVGARSAVFAPTPHLGLIVIDEEHETSFKQDTTPRYHARDVARQRAFMENVPLVLGSATPTLESWYRANVRDCGLRIADCGLKKPGDSAGGSEPRVRDSQSAIRNPQSEIPDVLLSLPKRVEARPLPPVIVIDVRHDPRCSKGAAIGRALESAIRGVLEAKGQIILFLNLRGYSPTLWCKACGETVKCPHCDITLTWHKDKNVALCHSCDHREPPLTHCPKCAAGGIRYLGVGTQRLEQEVKALFPTATCVRMDSDSMKRHGSHDAALEAFRKGEVQILLGTQMIAKGLDFPNVTLVGVINADTILHQPDLRASERTFQLISQVAGRTGRGPRGGRVLVQTNSPTEPAIVKAATHDYRGFVAQELPHRREMQTPPFRVFARIILRGDHEEMVQAAAKKFAAVIREAMAAPAGGTEPRREDEVRLLGPAPCPVAKLKNQYRFHLQLSAESLAPIQKLWHEVSPQLPRSEDVEFAIDVDPISMR